MVIVGFDCWLQVIVGNCWFWIVGIVGAGVLQENFPGGDVVGQKIWFSGGQKIEFRTMIIILC